MIQKTRRLWEREFNLVKQGIAEDQAVRFVDDLIRRYSVLAEQEQHFLSLGTLSEKAAIEADKVAKDIKARAKREAETDAGNTIAQAKEKAKEILALGKKRAQEVKQQEIETILQTARRTAAITETEVKQQAQLFLIKSREAIESELKEEVKEAYEYLLSSLQGLLSQASELEVQWKCKAVEPWSGQSLDLEHEEMNPTLTAESAATSPSVSQGNEAVPAVSEEVSTEEWEQLFGNVYPVATLSEEAEVDTPERGEAATGEADTLAPTQAEVVPGEHPQKVAKPKVISLQPKASFTYQGEVELTFIPPMEISAVSEIYGWLQTTPEVKILRTIGSWEKGTKVIVFLERPLPLIDILTRVPAVEVASELFEKQGLLKKTENTTEAEDKARGKYRIALKMQNN